MALAIGTATAAGLLVNISKPTTAIAVATAAAIASAILAAVSTLATTRGVENARRRTLHGEGLSRYRLQAVDAMMLGAHRASVGPSNESIPPYVRRDVDAILDSHLQGEPGLLVLVGPAMSGKTRTAFEALRRNLPDWEVIVPERGGSLEHLDTIEPQSSHLVVWLDDVERYMLTGELSTRIVRRLTGPGGAVLVATLRSREYARLVSEAPTLGGRAARAVLDMATVVMLDERLSPTERERADAIFADPRIKDALRHQEAPLAELLASSTELLQRWHGAANPTGAAVVRAAVDCRRAGLGWIPEPVLEALTDQYLPDQAKLSRERFLAGLHWATTPLAVGSSALLVARPNGTYAAADVIVDAVGDRGHAEVPGFVWSAVLAAATPAETLDVGISAIEIAPRLAEHPLRLAAKSTDTHVSRTATTLLGRLLLSQGRSDEATDLLRRAADAGETQAAILLGHQAEQRGAKAAAERWYRQAAEQGHTDAAQNLAQLLIQRGDTDAAVAWLRQAANAGDVSALATLGEMLVEQGDLDAAGQSLQEAADAGDTRAALALVDLLLLTGRKSEAATWQQRVAVALRPLLREALSRPLNLPPMDAYFVGRAAETNAIMAGLDQHDIILISGAAGSGKTALAIHSAHLMRDRFPDGQVFLSLHAQESERETVKSTLMALGIPPAKIPANGREAAYLLQAVAGGRQILFVLDDLREVTLAASLIRATRGKIIITSRTEMPDLTNAYHLRLDAGLQVSDAIQLLREQLRRVSDTDRVLSESDAIALVERCQGNPLALRVAVGLLIQHRDWTIPKLLEKLGAQSMLGSQP